MERQPSRNSASRNSPEKISPELTVLNHLRGQIVSGLLKAGTKLPSERTLGETLNVSRGYVRKALAKLEHYGLIQTLPQRGTIVAGLGSKAISGLIASIGSLDEAFDPASLFEIRALLEVFAARRAAERANPDDLTEILKWHSEFRVKTGEGLRALEEDHLFHLAIAKASANPVCLSLISYMTPQIISLNADFAESDPDRFRRSFDEHDTIVHRILEQDADGAAAAMQFHMDEAWQRRLPGTAPKSAHRP